MSSFRAILLLLIASIFSAFDSSDIFVSLPDGWPLYYRPLDLSKAIAVKCDFYKIDKISELRRKTKADEVTITYNLTCTAEPTPNFPFRRFSFAAHKICPTEESGKQKNIAWDFRQGLVTFYMVKEKSYGSPQLYRIVWYERKYR